jgi:hypothetical protein
LLYLYLFFITSSIFGQDEKVSKPSEITTKIKLGKQMLLPDGKTVLNFKKIVSDSRCPDGVSCVWAGEIVFEIEIIANNSSEIKQVTLGSDLQTLITEMTALQTHAVAISPYPKSGVSISQDNYVLTVVTKSKLVEDKF